MNGKLHRVQPVYKLEQGMKIFSMVLCLVTSLVLGTSSLSAKCYGFRDADVKVCVEGDGFKERKKAGEICKTVKGSDCGAVTGNSGSCTGPKCYGEDGKQNKNIKTNQ